MTFQSHNRTKKHRLSSSGTHSRCATSGKRRTTSHGKCTWLIPGGNVLFLSIFCYSGYSCRIPAGADVYSVFFQLLNRMWFPLNNSIIEKIHPEPTMVRDWLTERIQSWSTRYNQEFIGEQNKNMMHSKSRREAIACSCKTSLPGCLCCHRCRLHPR